MSEVQAHANIGTAICSDEHIAGLPDEVSRADRPADTTDHVDTDEEFGCLSAPLNAEKEDERRMTDVVTRSAGLVYDGVNSRADGKPKQPPPTLNYAEVSPVLTLLLGEVSNQKLRDRRSWIPKICASVAERADHYSALRALEPADEKRPELIFHGRTWADHRVSLDPKSADGLAARLEWACSRVAKFRKNLERELRRLVRWNPALFPELTSDPVGRENYRFDGSGPYTSTLEILSTVDGFDLALVSVDRRDEACDALMAVLKQRFLRNYPDSPFMTPLHAPRKHGYKAAQPFEEDGVDRKNLPGFVRYSLVEPGQGLVQYYFLDQLLAAFAPENISPEHLTNGLETRIFRLAKREPTAFPELFDSTKTALARSADLDSRLEAASDQSDGSEDLMMFDD